MTLERKIQTLKYGFIGLTVIVIGVAIIALTRPTQASPDPGTCLPSEKGGTGCDIPSFVKNDLAGVLYPVDSIMITVSNVNPGTYLGGTWVAWGTGQVPVGVDTGQTEFNAVEKTGGNKNMQQHNHTFNGTQTAVGDIVASHTHGIGTIAAAGEGAHLHTLSSHTHGLNGHTHSIAASTYSTGTQSANHTHTGADHRHDSTDGNTFVNVTGAMSNWSGISSGTTNTRNIPYVNSADQFTRSSRYTDYASYTGVGTTGTNSVNHTHTIPAMTTGGPNTSPSTNTAGPSTNVSGAVVNSGGTATTHTHTMSGSTGSAGASVAYTPAGSITNAGTGTAQNLQPYITCYMWKRTN